jgi:FMN-dependent oxidoreductase (nitrilotriacetate monooxygenase family)
VAAPGERSVRPCELGHYVHLARIAERGTFDSLFLADGPQLWGNLGQRPAGALEPLTLLTALATATEHIGLIATASTSYNSPYNLARKFASLDIISGGRAGWNIVTTAGAEAARNFGLDAEPAHAERYARAAEFLDVALKLWDSWEDDAIVADKAAGVWGDDTRIHPPGTRAVTSASRAPSTCRAPRRVTRCWCRRARREDGKEFAARYAEAVFTAQQTIEDAQAFYADLKSRTAAAGRDPDHIKVLPGIVPSSATEAEALASGAGPGGPHRVRARCGAAWKPCSNCRRDTGVGRRAAPDLPEEASSRAPRAATRSSWSWPGASASPCGS